jgi:hypothetical protein
VLISPRHREAIASGQLTVMYRRWKRAQVLAGRRYRTGAGMIEVDAVDVVDEADLSDADRAQLRGEPSAGTRVYRIELHAISEPDPRTVLADSDDLTDDDLAEIDRRLDRLDRASTHGPWTRATLALIAAKPATRAADLAAEVGRDTPPFKLDVRKLKALGLTISLERGYRLSPRGVAYLRRSGTA